ncbi:MAG: CotH kinase family protein [Planctomycetota bacterium]|jgi:spore coat protein CotH
MKRYLVLLAVSWLVVPFPAPGLAGQEPESAPSPAGTETDDVFDADHVVDVRIKLAPEDWGKLRHEGRGLASTWSGHEGDFEYTYFDATVTVDGERIEHAGVRKKGFLGSLSVLRPSLKIDFSRFNDGKTCLGMKRMTLNNDHQDPSHMHQVMSYALFRKAGVAAPRCNFARVAVNGEKLGVYSNVEGIRRPFLARHFKDDSGNLYEGQATDFAPKIVSEFQRKTNRDEPSPDRSDLDRVVEALTAKDAELLAELKKVIDVDAFLTFWAMEVIVGHWDGYTGDRNNYYIYRDPATDLFHFIPWGTDGAFGEGHAFLPVIPDSVYAWSQIPYRLYRNPKTRAIYHERLKSLLNDVWDEDALLKEVDRIRRLLSVDKKLAQAQRKFITRRKNAILEELPDGGPAWSYPPMTQSRKRKKPLEVKGTFSATWGSTDNFVTNKKLSLTLTLDGKRQVFSSIRNSVGMDRDEAGNLKKNAAIKLLGVRESGTPLVVVLCVMPSFVKAGDVPFHGFETFGIVVGLPGKSGDFQMLGLIGDGTITFDAAGTTKGDSVSGSFKGLLAPY